MLDAPISSIKGIGPRRAELLGGMGLFVLGDLIGFLPSAYKDFSSAVPLCDAVHGSFAAVRLSSAARPTYFRMRGGAGCVSMACSDGADKATLVWFNQPYAVKRVPESGEFLACGKVDRSKGIHIINPVVCSDAPGVVPEYTLPRGIPQKVFRSAVAAAFSAAPELSDPLPAAIRERFDIPEMRSALYLAHFPRSAEDVGLAARRLAFEDMLRFTLMTGALRRRRSAASGISFSCGYRDDFLSRFSFSPTSAQLRVMGEIERDMSSAGVMNRLIQGDVGSGKTFLALYAMYIAVMNGYQAALMAPTEILAQQHYAQIKTLFGDGASILTGGMTASETRGVLAGIADGSVRAVTGSQALFSKTVKFENLGLVVVDEQHRFGVGQRAALYGKGGDPDTIVMSATPIPRTLALLMYGDLDCSVVDELPAGRLPVKTRFIRPAKRQDMYRFIGERVAEGGQAYIVCPMIDSSEGMDVRSAVEVYSELKTVFGDRVALLHGRMSAEEKAAVLTDFRNGAVGMLVSTTIIEVGMDVSNATIMVIEAAERYGLSQLHQLRGRVGRGAGESFCFLLSSVDDTATNERIRTLVSTNDGFRIAERDLELRGPGQFLGQRQHGLSSFSGLAGSTAVIEDARMAADALLAAGETDADARQYIAAAVADSSERLGKIILN